MFGNARDGLPTQRVRFVIQRASTCKSSVMQHAISQVINIEVCMYVDFLCVASFIHGIVGPHAFVSIAD